MGKPNLHDFFKFGDKLGSGTFATVVLVTENSTKKQYAMKIIEKAKSRGMEEQIIKEITILKRIQHPNIVRLFECYETRDKIYMQMDVDGGELFDRIVNLGFYGEEDARAIVKSILEAVKYLHEAAQDLKPENLLMASKDEHSTVKLADFGLSTIVTTDSMLKTSCGTLTYCAPEILKGEAYGKPVDLWSTGVISYILLSGYPPFWDKEEAAMMELTLRGKFTFFSPDWDEITDTAKDFITKLIQVDPVKRLTAQQALQHKWITKETSSEQKINMIERVGDNLVKHFNARRKLKVGMDAVKFINTIRHLGQMHIGFKGKDTPGGPSAENDLGIDPNEEIVRSTAPELTMTFGTGDGGRIQDRAEMRAILADFAALGFDELDTARLYCDGNTEEVLAELQVQTAPPRFKVATKAFPFSPGMHEPAKLREQLAQSLAALKTDRVDLFYLHAPDHATPIEHTLAAVAELHREGRFTEFGLSNYSAWQVMDIWHICKANGYVLPTVYQGRYNAISRDVERELFPCLRKLGIRFYAYNPLGGGLLTGKHAADKPLEAGSRYDPNTVQGDRYRQRFWKDEIFDAISTIRTAADAHGLRMADIAHRWIALHSKLDFGRGDAIIIGASSLAQARENMADCLKTEHLPADVLAALDDAWRRVSHVAPTYFR
ncbi:hypothetical protein HK105_208819 [Polyrhizophydium stewartii]|uniref:Protein kinase domain-containing protein n=1 Tax=Polyrhizophydium stewartii TaxID=2732419 RepID=A0ABR4MWU9_9FUNG|nr:hypothetical protein HK105_006562 [Polyrhizophydium stewartii]